MLHLSYSITPDLQQSLVALDTLRTAILKAPLSPKTELKLRWEAQCARIAASFTLAGYETSSPQVSAILAHPLRTPTHRQQQIQNYHRALTLIAFEWLSWDRPITPGIIRALATTADPTLHIGQTKLVIIKQLLDYLQAKESYPALIAATASYFFLTDPVLAADGGLLARLVGTLFLAKYALDVRGLLVPEVPWLANEALWAQALAQSQQTDTLTRWLEVTTLGLVSNLTQTVNELKQKHIHGTMPAAFFALSDRQKSILDFLSHPKAQATNKSVQKRFGVSQITASRDLTKLAHLGLLYSHGHGRTTSYTRA